MACPFVRCPRCKQEAVALEDTLRGWRCPRCGVTTRILTPPRRVLPRETMHEFPTRVRLLNPDTQSDDPTVRRFALLEIDD